MISFDDPRGTAPTLHGLDRRRDADRAASMTGKQCTLETEIVRDESHTVIRERIK
jgi:hypothetical protein